MALVTISRVSVISLARHFCIPLRALSHARKPTPGDIKKSVFISQSDDVFSNLALERWIYDNFDLQRHHILMLWRNSPCVTLGLHQNPWHEVNLSGLDAVADGTIALARRDTGGDTFYHDAGNLNMTFFTPTTAYDRKRDLRLLARAIFRKYSMKVTVSSNEGLFIHNSKIAHTAVKWGSFNSYHHCSLYARVNKIDLNQALLGHNNSKYKVANLCEQCPQATINGLISAVGWEFLRSTANSLIDGGMDLANQQNGFQMINPSEEWFPGLSKIRQDLCRWEWCYGKTPAFTITKCFHVPFLNNYGDSGGNLEVRLFVNNGIINNVQMLAKPSLSTINFNGKAKIVASMEGHKFTDDTINLLEWSLGGSESSLSDVHKDKFVTEDHRRIVTSI